MNNVKMSVKGETLTITIDLKQELGLSKSGKTIMVASTGGNAAIPDHDGMAIGVNCFKYPKREG